MPNRVGISVASASAYMLSADPITSRLASYVTLSAVFRWQYYVQFPCAWLRTMQLDASINKKKLSKNSSKLTRP